MDPIKLRLSTWKDGAEMQTVWSFTPLLKPRSYTQARETGNDGEGRARRRPFNIGDVLNIKIPAGLLLEDTQFKNFLRLAMAHKVELLKTVAGQLTWVEYDVDGLPDPAHPEDVDRLRSYQLKFMQSFPVWYTEFEASIDDFENS